MYDEVKVFFNNDTVTIFYVLEDEDIQDAIIELCEDNGWDSSDVTNYQIIGTFEEE